MNKSLLKLILIITLVFLLLVSCGKNETAEDKETAITDINLLQEQMLSVAAGLPNMSTVNSNSSDAEYSFSYLCNIDYSKVENYFLSYSNSATADEIAVICLKEKNDTNAALESLQSHLNDRISLFSSYAPEEVTRLKEALVFSEGSYAVLIVCNNPKEVRQAFMNIINE